MPFVHGKRSSDLNWVMGHNSREVCCLSLPQRVLLNPQEAEERIDGSLLRFLPGINQAAPLIAGIES